MDLAVRLARIALGHVSREYPNKLDQVLTGPADLRSPASLHPVFHGSFDWHSCVHGYWLLARLLALFPSFAPAGEIEALFDRQLLADKVAGECAFLDVPSARGFERPYGWAWLLKLAHALGALPQADWSGAIRPLALRFARRFAEFLPIADYPVRAGTHPNTAFGLRMAADWAEGVGDGSLFGLLVGTAERWYGEDADCPAWGEPGGEDFHSPALMEAECMRRLLPAARFDAWFARFLPDLAEGRPATLFRPATVSDRGDGKIAHLDGLNLSRAWCLGSLAGAVGEDRRAPVMRASAERHLAAGLPHLEGDYMGSHWLASFALLALEA